MQTPCRMRYYLLLFPLLLACEGVSVAPLDPPQYDPDAFESKFLEIELTPGDQQVGISNGISLTNFQLHVPEDTSSLRPLVVALHWSGDSNAYREYFDCLAVPGLDTLDAFIIAPQDNENDWGTTINLFNVTELRRLALRHWPVDSTRLLVTGYSLGGIGTFNYADNYPELFSAAMPMAGSYRITNPVELPVFFIHGENDELFPLVGVEQEVQSVQDLGGQAELLVVPNLGHGRACEYVPALREGAAWLLDGVWR